MDVTVVTASPTQAEARIFKDICAHPRTRLAPMSVEEALEELHDAYAYFITRDGTRATGALAHTAPHHGSANIFEFTVIAPERQKSVGTRALRLALTGPLRDVRKVNVLVDPENIPACRLFRRAGFVRGHRYEQFINGEPRVRFTLERGA